MDRPGRDFRSRDFLLAWTHARAGVRYRIRHRALAERRQSFRLPFDFSFLPGAGDPPAQSVVLGNKLFFQEEAEIHPDKNPVLRLFRRWVPVTKDYVGNKFFVRSAGLYATPLFVVLLVVETTDLLFAVDSIPAILAITRDAFIVYTSNVFAILGLRSMYFALAGMMEMFRYLHYGLSLVLISVGAKMLLSHYFEIPTAVALAAVAGVLAISVIASMANPKKKAAE